ncbi:MAG: nitroreductase family deazaflavin-dependent oxidoreductase [Deltaproteobacteria bacterium]|nr:nitroreductase family deazaflavin-dependent oxidoreductase [Deltaproteobacteria bacterium]
MELNPWMASLVRAMSRLHNGLYRTLGGAGFMNRNTLILTTSGRKTGRESSTPLLYVEDGGRLYIVGSFDGSDTPPGWYRNLVAHPEVKVELAGATRRYRARTLGADEARPIWPKLLAIYPAYESYQKKTTRVIPVIELAPLAT